MCYDIGMLKCFDIKKFISSKEQRLITIIGSSGSGKSKLAEDIYYNNNPNPRSISLINTDILFLNDYVYHELEDILYNLNYPSNKILNTINNSLEFLDMNNIINKRISDLSRFEKIKLFIVKRIIYSPKIVVVDDIFKLCSEQENLILLNIFKKLSIKTKIIIFSHNIESLLYADKSYYIKENIKEIDKNYIIKNDNILVKDGIKFNMLTDLSVKLINYGLIDDIYLEEDKLMEVLWLKH